MKVYIVMWNDAKVDTEPFPFASLEKANRFIEEIEGRVAAWGVDRAGEWKVENTPPGWLFLATYGESSVWMVEKELT